jgi:hypothetical protein
MRALTLIMLGKVLERISKPQSKIIWDITGQNIINYGLMMSAQN